MRSSNAIEPIKVLIVDDEAVVLSSLRKYFSMVDDIEVVAEATNGNAALATLKNMPVDVVLADIHMEGMDGIALLDHISSFPHPPAFVALTGIDTDDNMLRVLSMGAAGYVVKSARPAQIIESIYSAAADNIALLSMCLARILEHIPQHSNALPTVAGENIQLTPAEQKVLALLCQGLSNAEIAKQANYAESTVKRHVSNLISYFGASSRLSLALVALGYSRFQN